MKVFRIYNHLQTWRVFTSTWVLCLQSRSPSFFNKLLPYIPTIFLLSSWTPIQHFAINYILSFLYIYLRPIIVDHPQTSAASCHLDIYTVSVCKARYSPTSWNPGIIRSMFEIPQDSASLMVSTGGDQPDPSTSVCIFAFRKKYQSRPWSKDTYLALLYMWWTYTDICVYEERTAIYLLYGPVT